MAGRVAIDRQVARSAHDWVVRIAIRMAVVASRKSSTRRRVDGHKFLGDTDCAFRVTTQGVEVFQADQVSAAHQIL